MKHSLPPSSDLRADEQVGAVFIEGDDRVMAKIMELNGTTQTEVVSFVTGRARSAESIRQSQNVNSEMYSRGIRSRTIYLSSVRNHKATRDHVRWLNEQGSQVRTAPSLPLQMVIADGAVAVLAHEVAGKNRGIAIYYDQGVVTGLQALFEMVWVSSAPLGLTFSTDGETLSFDERALLEMFALGRIDK